LNLFESKIAPLDPQSPKTPYSSQALRNFDNAIPTLEQNMKWIGSPVAEIWPFAYVGGIWNPHFGGKRRS